MKPTDEERLRHLTDALEEALEILGERTSAEVAEDRTRALALVKLIEIAGEAAAHVSDARRARHAEVPWEKLTAVRNRLIHGYYDVNVAIVVQTVREEFPRLLDQLEDIE